MSDYVCTEFEQVIPIVDIQLIDAVTFNIKAHKLSQLKRIAINGVTATDFVVISNTNVYVTIPVEIRNSQITSVSLIGSSDDAAIIQLTAVSKQLMNSSVYVLQKFLRLLFMRPGSDMYNPTHGADISSVTGGTSQGIRTQLLLRIKTAEQQLISMQPTDISADKSLARVEILNLNFNMNTLTASIRLRLHTVDGGTVNTQFNIIGS